MIFKIDTKIDLKKVEAVSVSYVKGFGDGKYRRFDDLQICKYCGFWSLMVLKTWIFDNWGYFGKLWY